MRCCCCYCCNGKETKLGNVFKSSAVSSYLKSNVFVFQVVLFITTRGEECCKALDADEKNKIRASIFDLVLLNIAETDPPADWQAL